MVPSINLGPFPIPPVPGRINCIGKKTACGFDLGTPPRTRPRQFQGRPRSISYRQAILAISAPGASVSAAIRSFSSKLLRRRCSTPVMISINLLPLILAALIQAPCRSKVCPRRQGDAHRADTKDSQCQLSPINQLNREPSGTLHATSGVAVATQVPASPSDSRHPAPRHARPPAGAALQSPRRSAATIGYRERVHRRRY
jgi:hypothetical protein